MFNWDNVFNRDDVNVCVMEISYSMTINAYSCDLSQEMQKMKTNFPHNLFFHKRFHMYMYHHQCSKPFYIFVVFFAVLNCFFFFFYLSKININIEDIRFLIPHQRTFISTKFSFQIYQIKIIQVKFK